MKCEIQDPERREQGKKQDHNSRFQESKLALYKDLVGRISWDTVLKKKYVQESSMIAKDHLFQTQELSIPVFRKSNKSGRRPAWALHAPLQGALQTCKKGMPEVEAR